MGNDGQTFESQGPAVIAMFLDATGGNYPAAVALWEYEHSRELAGLSPLPAGHPAAGLPAAVQQALAGGQPAAAAAAQPGARDTAEENAAAQGAALWDFAKRNRVALLVGAGVTIAWRAGWFR